MNLAKLNVQELNKEEMVKVEGGNWFSSAWSWLRRNFEITVGASVKWTNAPS